MSRATAPLAIAIIVVLAGGVAALVAQGTGDGQDVAAPDREPDIPAPTATPTATPRAPAASTGDEPAPAASPDPTPTPGTTPAPGDTVPDAQDDRDLVRTDPDGQDGQDDLGEPLPHTGPPAGPPVLALLGTAALLLGVTRPRRDR